MISVWIKFQYMSLAPYRSRTGVTAEQKESATNSKLAMRAFTI